MSGAEGSEAVEECGRVGHSRHGVRVGYFHAQRVVLGPCMGGIPLAGKALGHVMPAWLGVLLCHDTRG